MKVHYTGWSTKYDEWIDVKEQGEEKIIQQWKRGERFRVNQRIDVKDGKNKWLEAQVIEVKKEYIKIHYRGWAAKFDEYLPVSHMNPNDPLLDKKYAEIGMYSKAIGQAKYIKER